MKKRLLLAFVLAASINVYSQETLTGAEPGTTTGPTDPAEINDPPVREGDPMNPNPDPPVMSRCPDYCFENVSECPLEVSIYYSSWQDCDGSTWASTGTLRRVIVLQPFERKCFGFACTTNGDGCFTINPRFYFGVSAIGSSNTVQIEREGGTAPADAIGCYYGVRVVPIGTPDGNYVYRIFTIWPPVPD